MEKTVLMNQKTNNLMNKIKKRRKPFLLSMNQSPSIKNTLKNSVKKTFGFYISRIIYKIHISIQTPTILTKWKPIKIFHQRIKMRIWIHPKKKHLRLLPSMICYFAKFPLAVFLIASLFVENSFYQQNDPMIYF